MGLPVCKERVNLIHDRKISIAQGTGYARTLPKFCEIISSFTTLEWYSGWPKEIQELVRKNEVRK